MSIFGKVGRAVGGGGIARAGQAMLGGGGGGQMGGAFGKLTSAMRQKAPGMIQQARPGFERLAQRGGIHGNIAKQWLAKNPAEQPPQPQMGQAPPQQMGQAEGSMGAGQMSEYGQPAGPTPPAVPFSQQIQQALTPPEFSDPYEAWKQGGRQGQRPY